MSTSLTDLDVYAYPYEDLLQCTRFIRPIRVIDHLLGFDQCLRCAVLDHVHEHCDDQLLVITDYRFQHDCMDHYPKLKFAWGDTWVNSCFQNYHAHPDIDHRNFLCSFNGSPHVGRKLLVACLHRFGWFDPRYVSKNFTYDLDGLDGHINDYLDPDRARFYRKFLIGEDSGEFGATESGFGHVKFDHARNIYNLDHRITQSFLHVVSESAATAYYPFVTEKFLYSVITRGLFLAYAQPGWHQHVSRLWGFKLYDKIFDYSFDSIENPVIRLVELMTMISKFSMLSRADWHDLYSMEKDSIEFNRDHYYSGGYRA